LIYSTKFFVFYIPYLHCLFGHRDIGTTPLLSVKKNRAEDILQEKSRYKFLCVTFLGKNETYFVHMARYKIGGEGPHQFTPPAPESIE
jgi:hypothetical protein